MKINVCSQTKMPRWDVLFLSAGVVLASSPALAYDREDRMESRQERELSQLDEHRWPRPPREPRPYDPTGEDPFPKPRMERDENFSLQ